MLFEPGILDLAHSKGIKFLDDVNHDGKIDKADLSLAMKAKTAGTASSVAPKAAAAGK